MPVNKTHRAIVTITFDRPITRAEALAHARHDLAGEYYLSGNQAVRRMNVDKVERLRPPRSCREAAARGREARIPTDAPTVQPSGISGEFAAPTPPAAEAPGQEPVAVKPLEWRPHVSDPAIQVADVYPFAFCIKEVAGFGYWSTGHAKTTTWNEVHGGLEAARSWVQGLYARIIRSVTVSAPPTYADAEALAAAHEGLARQKRTLACEAYAEGDIATADTHYENAVKHQRDADTIRSLASPAPKGEGQ